MKNILMRLVGARMNALAFKNAAEAGKAAFQKFCTPPPPYIKPKELEFLSTAKKTLVTNETQSYVQYCWGQEQAPYILCAYGWGYNAGRWRHFVPQLVKAGYRVIAFDPPGHGNCAGNFLNLMMNAEIIKHQITTLGAPYGILGHSFGGSTSIIALQDLDHAYHPKRFVLMASFSTSTPIFIDFAALLGLRSIVLKEMIGYADHLLGDKRIEDLDMAVIARDFGHIDALVVHDPKDEITPFAHAQRYHGAWPNAKLYAAIGGTHHLGNQKTTDVVIDHILAPLDVNLNRLSATSLNK